MRIVSLPGERWVRKAARGNPELGTKYKTYRAENQWEDEINDFFRPERTEDETTLKEITMNGSRQRKIRKVG